MWKKMWLLGQLLRNSIATPWQPCIASFKWTNIHVSYKMWNYSFFKMIITRSMYKFWCPSVSLAHNSLNLTLWTSQIFSVERFHRRIEMVRIMWLMFWRKSGSLFLWCVPHASISSGVVGQGPNPFHTQGLCDSHHSESFSRGWPLNL